MAKFKPQYRRILFIDRKIKEGSYPNCTTLADEWEVSAKTIQRDIDYIKYELDAPLEYDAVKHGYYYTEKNYKMPAISLSESDLFAVCIAEQALKEFEHTPLYSRLLSVFEKIEQSLPEKVTISPAWIENRIFFFSEPSTNIDLKIWDTVATALRENRQLKITHKSPSEKTHKERVVDPYHLVSYKHEWYLSSLCHDKESIRTFAVSRMNKVVLLKTKFTMPKEYDRDKMFGDTLGIVWSPDMHKVKIQFSKTVAPYIMERKWHPKQKVANKKDGSIVIEFTTNHIKEVKDWVLSWGPTAKVLGPKQLVDLVKSELKATLKNY